MKDKVNDKELARQIAVINSMTMQERRFPDLIKGNRKKRIADGCGQELHDVNRILKQFMMMEKMMKVKKGNMANMMRGMKSNVRGMRLNFCLAVGTFNSGHLSVVTAFALYFYGLLSDIVSNK